MAGVGGGKIVAEVFAINPLSKRLEMPSIK